MTAYRFIIFLVILIGIFITCACEKENIENNVFFGTEYFPLDTGNYIIYKITEITIDAPSNYYDTAEYYIKEVFESKIIDNQDDEAVRIERFKRTESNQNWVINNVWSAKIVNNSAQKVEENLRYVKIRFPAKENLSWNGNLFNELPDESYSITSIHTEFEINEFYFDSCLTITHTFSESLINKDFEAEIFAWNIGLVYKEITNLNSQEVIFDVPIENRITTGYIYIQEIIDYGRF
jgi:hypothetical protein